jgi:cytochrome c oxidase subunit II
MRPGPKWLYLIAALLVFVAGGRFAASTWAAAPEQVIQIKAKKFEYIPNAITLQKGVPVVLELTSLDRLHGFNCPAFKIRGDIRLRQATRIPFTPDKVGTFEFHCDIFCGEGHEDMSGKFVVTE